MMHCHHQHVLLVSFGQPFCAMQDVVIPVINPMNRLPVFGHDRSPLHPEAKAPLRDKVGPNEL